MGRGPLDGHRLRGWCGAVARNQAALVDHAAVVVQRISARSRRHHESFKSLCTRANQLGGSAACSSCDISGIRILISKDQRCAMRFVRCQIVCNRSI